MSSELDEVARALFNGQIPNIWRKLAPATLKSLGNWMEHFLKRLNQYNQWVSASFLCRWRIVVLFESQNQSWLDEICLRFFSEVIFLWFSIKTPGSIADFVREFVKWNPWFAIPGFLYLLYTFWNHWWSLQSDWLSAEWFFKDHAIFCSKSQLFEIAPFVL